MAFARAYSLTLFLLGLAAPTFAAPATSASRVPTKFADSAQADADADENMPVKCNGLQDEKGNCARQDESFKRASQAYSYLGFYMMNDSVYGKFVSNPKRLDFAQKSVIDCMQGKDCDEDKKKLLMASLIQYNMGKHVKSMILASRTREEGMRSQEAPKRVGLNYDYNSPQTPELLKGLQQMPRRSGHSYTQSFKITEKDLAAANVIGAYDPKKINERNTLGAEIKKNYEEFIDVFANISTTDEMKRDWNSNHTKLKNPKEGSTAEVWDLDPETKQPILRRERYLSDDFTQKSEAVQNVVKEFKGRLGQPKLEPTKPDDKKDASASARQPASKNKKQNTDQKSTDVSLGSDLSQDLRFAEAGLGIGALEEERIGKDGKKYVVEITDANEVAKRVSKKINDLIDKRSNEQKKPGSIVNVQLPVENFDAYLDKIWPDSGLKYRIPSSEK